MNTTNFLKVLAIISVVGLHVLSLKPVAGYFLDLNLIFRFSVPLFVALSGFGLAKSFSSRMSNHRGLPDLHGLLRLLGDYFVRRVLRLLPWYLFWGTILYLYINYIGQGPSTYGQTSIWTLFVFGKIDYHLYFVPMIVQLYLIFPLLWLAMKKHPRIILIAAFLWQLYWYNSIPSSGLSDQQQYVQGISWIFYFVLGIYLALKETKLEKRWWLKWGSIPYTLAGLWWTLAYVYDLKSLGLDPIIFTRFTQIPVLFYSVGFIVSGLFVIPQLLKKLAYSPANLLTTLLLSLGELSYLVYLNHTLVLRILTRPPFNLQQINFAMLFTITLIGSFLLSKLATLGIRGLLWTWQNLNSSAGVQN